jgi:hypothetical protein
VLSNKSNAVTTSTAISEGKRVSIVPRGNTTTTTEQKLNNKVNKLQQQKITNAPPQSPMPPCVEAGLELCSFNLLQETNGAITSSSSNYLLTVSEDEVAMSNTPSFQSPVVVASETVDAVEEKAVVEVQYQLVAEEPVEEPATTTDTVAVVAVAGLPMVEEREEDEDVHVVREEDVPPQVVDISAVVEEEEEEVQEHIMDVMDFLLESNEIDAATHHRLSSFSFSTDTLKRLSVCSAKDSIRMSISNNNNNIIVMLPSPLKEEQQIDHATEAPVMMDVDVDATAATHHDDDADPSVTEEEAVAVTTTDAMIDAGDASMVVVADYSSSSSSIAITTEEVSNEHVVSSSGVLLATELSSEPVIIEQSSYGIASDASSVSTESANIADAVIHGEVIISSTTIADIPIEGESSSSSSSTSSMPCLDEKPLQAEDVLVALRNFINNLDKNINIVEDKPPTKRVSDDGSSVLSKRGRSSCDDSSASDTAATFTHRSSIHLSPSSNHHHQATTTASKVSPHKQARLDDQATAAACEVMTYPLSELLDDALERGLVCVDLVNRCDSTGRVQYLLQTQVSRSTIIETMMIDYYPSIYFPHLFITYNISSIHLIYCHQILPVPGYPEENSKVRMLSYRHYSDFKALRTELLAYFKAKQKKQQMIMMQQQTAQAPPPTPPRSTDDVVFESILSRLPIHRPKHDRASDVRGCFTSAAAGEIEEKEDRSSMHEHEELPERCKLLLPKFPRHAIRMAINSDDAISATTTTTINEEAKIQSIVEDQREEFLRQWINTLFSRQCFEDGTYRTVLRKFLTN